MMDLDEYECPDCGRPHETCRCDEQRINPMEDRKFRNDTIKEEHQYDYGSVTGKFNAEIFKGQYEPLDTNVTITINDFSITWKDRHKLVQELSSVIKKYQI